jgi:quinoprotein glucose dehydrogenase
MTRFLVLGLVLVWSLGVPQAGRAAAGDDWAVYLGDKASSQYSTLDEIRPENVASLEVAWEFRSGDARADNRSQVQCNPLVIGGVLYGTTAGLALVALDAATGEQRWRFDPGDHDKPPGGVNRGVVFWSDGGGDRRVLYASDHWLHAVDAATGRLVPSFGVGGSVDLKDGLGRDVSRLALNSTTPGVVFGDLLVMGMRLGEGPAPAAPGHIRAYDIRTGQIAWRFNTIPQPGESGAETWPPDAWRHIGGANVWSGFALDEERGLVFCPTGSAAFDFWGGNRLGENLFANSLVALDARTGRRLWHYQFVRHDLWDRDLPAPPNLLTVEHGGRRIDAVAQVTKSGHVFVFDRESGQPLFPVEEIPVPPSDLQGESAWPTQPVPAKPAPFSRQLFSADEITDISAESRRAVLDQFVKLRPHAPFLPPSREGTVIFPGFDGGAEWGGAAADPDGVLYVNANEMPWILTMVEAPRVEGRDGEASGPAVFAQLCAPCHGPDGSGNPAQNVPTLAGLADRLKPEGTLALLDSGKGVMPSFAFLTDAQKRAVTSHLYGGAVGGDSAGGAADGEGPPSVLGAVPYSHTGYNRWFDPDGYPAVKPPWGTLNAIDLNTGEFLWRVPLGEFPELTARGVPPTGTENYGGPVVTAGGLVFIAACKDEHIRAFDRASGRELWKHRLPAGGYATPATYRAGGRQFVVIACGGGKMGTKSGDSWVAFALPGGR